MKFNSKTQIKKKYLYKSGFSLIEMLLILGLISIAMVAAMSALDYTMKGQIASEQRVAVSNVQEQIFNFIQNGNICKSNFNNTTVATMQSSLNVTQLNDSQPTPQKVFEVYGATTPGAPAYENNSIRIKSMSLKNFLSYSSTATPNADGQADLEIVYEKNKAANGASEFKARVLKLKTKLNGNFDMSVASPYTNGTNQALKIVNCATAGSANLIWTQNPDDTIFYTGGNVGVGAAAPGAKLELAGVTAAPALSVQDGSGIDNNSTYGMVNLTRPADTTKAHLAFIRTGAYVWQMGYLTGTNNFGIFPWNFSGVQGIPAMTLTTGGNIGIGTANPQTNLDVAGGIRPGAVSQGTACNAEGTFGYDYSIHAPVFCNGTIWQRANGGGMYQTYHCNGSCRRANPNTGACSCPPGYSAAPLNEVNTPPNAPCGSQTFYELKGMIQYLCY